MHLERISLGWHSVTVSKDPSWDGLAPIAILIWVVIFVGIAAFGMYGWHVYKRGRWQANWYKIIFGTLIVALAVTSPLSILYAAGGGRPT